MINLRTDKMTSIAGNDSASHGSRTRVLLIVQLASIVLTRAQSFNGSAGCQMNIVSFSSIACVLLMSSDCSASTRQEDAFLLFSFT